MSRSKRKPLNPELKRLRRKVRTLAATNAVTGVALVIIVAVWAQQPDPLFAQAENIVAGLHCPCPGCDHANFTACAENCGEHRRVRDFVLRELGSGLDTLTVLKHVREDFGDLTTREAAEKTWRASTQPSEEDM